LLASGSHAAMKLAQDGKARATIVTGAKPTPAEQTAAKELAHYLSQVTGAQFRTVPAALARVAGPVIQVGGTVPAELGPEEWAIRTTPGRLTLTGGRPRGTLYAVYHFLEDVVGVRWWNPWEEHVPRKPTLGIGDLNLRGKPRIRYRDIYMLYGHDRGRFAARNRLNRDGDAGIAPAFGGDDGYGPPYHVHTFYMYIPPKQYFAEHPEWFSMVGGKRDAHRKQLCLTNAELRKTMLGKLRAYIEQTRAKAAKEGTAPPRVFELSQNDWGGFCECPTCQAIARREGGESGPLFDFLNHMADAIRPDYPDVLIGTLAYFQTQAPPKTLRPRDNIVIRLCDTGSNFTRPITHDENTAFREHVARWAKVAKNLRVWDYAVTYAPYYGLPLPTVHTYAPDYRFYAEHNVTGVFTEHEYPILADLRDLKVWMMIKLLEDPYGDVPALVRTFTDGFYGPAAPHVRRYLAALEQAAEAKPSHLSMGASPRQYRYLDLPFIRSAQAIFDEAEKAVGNDATLLRRVRHARLPLDRATVVLYPQFVKQWVRVGGKLEQMPLDRKAIAERYRTTWHAQADLRLPPGQRIAEKAKADAEVKFLLARLAYVPLPKKFAALPPADVFQFTADETRNWQDQVKRVPAADAESGITNRLELDANLFRDPKADRGRSYKLPMPWGLYNVGKKQGSGGGTIKPGDVPGPGYHWHKLGTFRIRPTDYVYFFWSWIIQVDVDNVVDPKHPDRRFDVWARIKLEGPGFPHGKADAKNAICVERVVLTKAEAK
ncbi:DUF4838 domain-containing protein, partial [bacterium]|nr:DUF4838 domain-containing protein [bacterium]